MWFGSCTHKKNPDEKCIKFRLQNKRKHSKYIRTVSSYKICCQISSIFEKCPDTAQSCDLTNFCILGNFEGKMADDSDFKKTPHFICLKLNQICFTSLFCCCQVFICFKIKFLTTNVKTLITGYLMKIGFENPRFSLFSDAICSKS